MFQKNICDALNSESGPSKNWRQYISKSMTEGPAIFKKVLPLTYQLMDINQFLLHSFGMIHAIKNISPEERLQVIPLLMTEMIGTLPWIKNLELPMNDVSKASDEELIFLGFAISSMDWVDFNLKKNLLNTFFSYKLLLLFKQFLEKDFIDKDRPMRVLHHLDQYIKLLEYFLKRPVEHKTEFWIEMSHVSKDLSNVLKKSATFNPIQMDTLTLINDLYLHNHILNDKTISWKTRLIDYIKTTLEGNNGSNSYDEIKEDIDLVIYSSAKPLHHFLENEFSYIEEMVMIISQISISKNPQRRIEQLVELATRLHDVEEPSYLLTFFIKIYTNYNAFDAYFPGASDTIREFLVIYFLSYDLPDFGEDGYFLINLIIEKQNFDVALAYCLAIHCPLSVKPSTDPMEFTDSRSRVAIYNDLIVARKMPDLNSSWFEVIREKSIPITIYMHFSRMYSILTSNYIASDPSRVSIICHLLDGERKGFENSNPETFKKTTIFELNHKMLVYSDILVKLIESTSSRHLCFNVAKECDPCQIPLLLRVLSSHDLLIDVFKQVISPVKGASSKLRNTIYSMMHRRDYITDLSTSLGKLKTGINPESFLKDADDMLTNRKVNVVLFLMILVCRDLKETKSLPNQEAWIQLSIQLLEWILINAKGSQLEQVMTHVMSGHDLLSYIPKKYHPRLFDILQRSQIDWVLDDQKIDYLVNSLFPVSKIMATSKKSRKSKQVVEQITLDYVEPPQNAGTVISPFSDAFSATSPAQLMFASCSDESLMEPDRSSPETKEGVVQEVVVVEELSLGLIKSPLESFNKRIKARLKPLIPILLRLHEIVLPDAWNEALMNVTTSLNGLLHQIGAELLSMEAIEKKFQYVDFDQTAQRDLEYQWNRVLSSCCWSIQREIEEYLKSNDPQGIDVAHGEKDLVAIHDVLTEWSCGYYKNLSLHFSEKMLQAIQKITELYEANGYRVFINGSFVFPKKSRDLDFLLIPTRPIKTVIEHHDVMEKATKLMPTVFSLVGARYDKYSQQVLFFDGISKEGISLDLIFSSEPLSKSDLLDKTLGSILSTPAVLWSTKGTACMVPKAARANCDEKLVLVPTVHLSSGIIGEDWISYAGFVCKHLVKSGKDVTLSPQIKQFLGQHIHPKTRTNSNLNQRMVINVLSYLLTHFQSRKDGNIEFILKNQLMEVLLQVFFPETSQLDYLLCAKFFKDHFQPEGDSFPIALSKTQFLAMFFLPLIMGSSSDQEKQKMDRLKTMTENTPRDLKFIMDDVIAILRQLPPTTNWFHLHYIAIRHETFPIDKQFDVNVLAVLNAWHPAKDPELQVMDQSIPSIVKPGSAGITFFKGASEARSSVMGDPPNTAFLKKA